MHRWRRLRSFSWRERWLLLQALGLLPLTALAVRLVGFRRWHFALAHVVPADQSQTSQCVAASLLPRAKVTARIVRMAARHGFYSANCLQQSLSLWWLLRRQGIESNLRIGVRKDSSKLEAHAWVEFLGVALHESDEAPQVFIPFARPLIPGGLHTT